jgi:hypothetical protein
VLDGRQLVLRLAGGHLHRLVGRMSGDGRARSGPLAGEPFSSRVRPLLLGEPLSALQRVAGVAAPNFPGTGIRRTGILAPGAWTDNSDQEPEIAQYDPEPGEETNALSGPPIREWIDEPSRYEVMKHGSPPEVIHNRKPNPFGERHWYTQGDTSKSDGS